MSGTFQLLRLPLLLLLLPSIPLSQLREDYFLFSRLQIWLKFMESKIYNLAE
jgi:hypothetical protein